MKTLICGNKLLKTLHSVPLTLTLTCVSPAVRQQCQQSLRVAMHRPAVEGSVYRAAHLVRQRGSSQSVASQPEGLPPRQLTSSPPRLLVSSSPSHRRVFLPPPSHLLPTFYLPPPPPTLLLRRTSLSSSPSHLFSSLPPLLFYRAVSELFECCCFCAG